MLASGQWAAVMLRFGLVGRDARLACIFHRADVREVEGRSEREDWVGVRTRDKRPALRLQPCTQRSEPSVARVRVVVSWGRKGRQTEGAVLQ